MLLKTKIIVFFTYAMVVFITVTWLLLLWHWTTCEPCETVKQTNRAYVRPVYNYTVLDENLDENMPDGKRLYYEGLRGCE